ncbi:MAG: phosphoribosylamine--glycine ligase [Candidatus Margulisbacteria bacterium]|nr:phosphoribosylamine--glycine ligase [Candidatus Margulisiibacteriota bacterium]MBU1021071.1 phosphoribosylamine--glycine ligase [Candidatus Margulisiibacteriota bacterium]MBU1729880.1 phosphoribosylamine--glycine ligase [Candidatus Margulisiibacteriota bacterium]MBU1955210.1 phosphoribosylamine--glycine ligase [Candidatus Margulisiibacteriota bacterium]
MKILVIGSGGREHTLCWKIKQSPKVEQVYCAPGNAGTALVAENLGIAATDIAKLAEFAERNKIDMTVVGPEAPLVEGIVDEFEKRGLRVFGPSRKAAYLEGSKIFSKNIMKKYNVPTADFKVFTESADAIEYIEQKGAPLVVKADGLAAGKGVFVAKNTEEAIDAVKTILDDEVFGEAGSQIIIEDCLMGEEASILAFTDGKTIIPMASSQDHKRVNDNDEGPNTGGMGAYSPAPVVTDALMKKINDEILIPTIKGMEKEGVPYKGVLYCGVMVTKDGPSVLEFNVRFGDPETQVILPRMKTDIVDLFDAVIDGKLKDKKIDWENKDCVCVVMASGGYPGKYEKGIEIKGLEAAAKLKDTVVFHAGTALDGEKIVTSGGRVLGVTALGKGIKAAIDAAYAAVSKISFEGAHYRKDIGKRALNR